MNCPFPIVKNSIKLLLQNSTISDLEENECRRYMRNQVKKAENSIYFT
jgi:hypothetical protein